MRTRNAASPRDQAGQPARRAGLPLGPQRRGSPEGVLLPADRPADAALGGRQVGTQVLAVQRVAHLGAQRVPGAQAGRRDSVLLTRGEHRVPDRPGGARRHHQFVAAFAGVAGAADGQLDAVQAAGVEAHVVVADRQPDGGQGLVRERPLHGQDGVVVVLVGDGDALGGGGAQQRHHLGGVGRVGDQEDLVVGEPVPDQVVDHPAGLIAEQGVLRLADADLGDVVGDAGVQEVGGPGAGDPGLAQVADVEDADTGADSLVLGHDPGVLQRHRPAAELGEFGAERLVAVVQG